MVSGWWSPGDATPTIAIAVCTSDGRNMHVGIAYCVEDNNEQMHLIHLAWHCKLEVEIAFDPISSGYLCLVPRLPQSMMEAVASRCRSTARHKPKLRYGFLAQQDAYIDKDGHYFVRDDRGQNCSSFVILLFRSVQVTLVQAETWPNRPDDEDRYRELLFQLREYVRIKYVNDPEERHIHEEFVRKIAPDVTAIRIRPEETAGSCLSDSLPVAFEKCEAYGKVVLLAAVERHIAAAASRFVGESR